MENRCHSVKLQIPFIVNLLIYPLLAPEPMAGTCCSRNPLIKGFTLFPGLKMNRINLTVRIQRKCFP